MPEAGESGEEVLAGTSILHSTRERKHEGGLVHKSNARVDTSILFQEQQIKALLFMLTQSLF